MKIIRDNSVLKENCYLVGTIGYFDGIHLGHKKILSKLVNEAKSKNGKSVLITFWPHPRTVLNQGESVNLLLSENDKHKNLKSFGVDILYIIEFTKEFSKLSALSFVREFLEKKIQISKLIIGYNHSFGHNREGNFEYLKKIRDKYSFEIEEVKKKEINNSLDISSSEIRKKINCGEIFEARRMLGYNYYIRGIVVKGDGIGKKINFPTANIQIENNMSLVPKDGVYAGKAIIENHVFKGMINIGFRPTLEGKLKRIEINIFDMTKDIYGKSLKIIFINRIRNEIKFDSLKKLELQLVNDKKEALKIIKNEEIRN